jgi:hypothetical protein
MVLAFLTAIGVLYAGLALWCSFQPRVTSQTVGFELVPGSGQSEFLTVYGGLELGLALIFLWPWVRPQSTEFALTSCLLVHACLVLFRTASFLTYSGISTSTYKLAAGEWVIFVASAILMWRR